MKKRVFSILLVLAMVASMLPISIFNVSAATLPEITGLHRGVLADGEAPDMVYWDAVDGVEKYEVKVTQGTTTKTKFVYDSCASWTEIFYGGHYRMKKDLTFTVEVTGGYSYGNRFIYETDTATIDIATERQPVIFWTIGSYTVVRGETYTENLWVDKKFDNDFYYFPSDIEDWDDVSGYPKFKLVDAPAWIQLWSNSVENGWCSEEVYMTFDPPADCTVGTYEFWIAVATSDTDGLLIPFKLPVGAYRGEDTQYWIQNMSIESPDDALVYWNIWKGVDAYEYLNATVIQGETGNIYEGQTAASILQKQGSFSSGNVTYEVEPFAINLQNADGQLVKRNDVIDIGKYRYQFSSKTITYRDPDVWANIYNDIYLDENLKVYLDGKLQDVVVKEFGEYKVKSAQWEFYSPWIYVYDEKPEINSVKVNGESVADGDTITANNSTVTIATNYDGLSDALKDYGCSVKQLSAYYLNGEKINMAMIVPADNGDGTATNTYSRILNPGDELRVESWLEVIWPDGHTDRMDEHTVTVSGPSRQFITQPHYAGDGMQTGENYVEWKLNFTPVKLIARYNLGNAARPNWKEVELDATKSRASLPAISQKYTLYAFYGEGARDFVASDAFSAKDAVDFTPAFTLQPANGVSVGGAYAEVTWATNFVPVKLQVLKYSQGYCTGSQDLDVNATTASVKAGDEYCIIRAYYSDSNYVDSNKFIVTEMNYYNAWFYVDDTVLDNVMVLEGDYVARPVDPVKDGYTFLGWYTDDDEAYNFAAPVTADVHLTAWFEQNEPEYIDTIHIEGLPAPQYGQTVGQWDDACDANWETGTLKYSNADKVWDDGWDYLDSNRDFLDSKSTDTITEGTYYWRIYFGPKTSGYAFADDLVATVDGVNNANVTVEDDGDGWVAVYVKYEVEKPAEPPVSGAKPGDVNGDGKVNVRDIGVMQQYMNGWEVTMDMDAADVNNDGKVNVRDIGLMQQWMNGWDVELI